MRAVYFKFGWRGRARGLALLLAASVFLSACAAPGDLNVSEDAQTSTESSRVSQNFYSPFFDQGDHLRKLVTAREFTDAATLFDEQSVYFAKPENRKKFSAPLMRVAANFNDPAADAVTRNLAALTAVRQPPAADGWTKIKSLLADSRKSVADYPDLAILRDPEFRLGAVDTLGRETGRVAKILEKNVDGALAAFDHFGAKSFFDAYPVSLSPKKVLSGNFKVLANKLDRASAPELERFIALYPPKSVLPIELYDRASRAYRESLIAREKEFATPNLVRLFTVLRKLKKAGFQATGDDEQKIGFVEVTSKTLLQEGQIEYPIEINPDIPVTAVKAELDDALSDTDGPKYLIIIDVALAKASRRVLGIKKMPSKVLTGYKEEINPDYNVVQNEINNARLGVQQASMSQLSADSQYCNGLACLGKLIGQIAALSAVKKAQGSLDELMVKLGNTPQMLKTPVFAKYKYDKASIKANKIMTIHYYVVDKEEKKYFKSSFDIQEKKSFEVAYRVLDDDPNRESVLANNNTEKEVTDWEEEAATVKLSDLVDHYIGNIELSKRLPGLEGLRAEMLADKNIVLAKFQSEKFNAKPLNDPRFDSVVVIYTGKGSLGSGFFIKDDVVLTNWHVVKNSAFVEMKTYDGQETFGKVIAKDVRLDLALIKVQTRGRPVSFYTNKTLDLGRTVEAIGHPKRLEFSITRGIISAVREFPSINLPKGSGDEVLFIQTDAPINTGNSGGPLFLGNRVIGVNTWGVVKNVAEGLNFSVHYSEVLKFLKEYLPRFQISKR